MGNTKYTEYKLNIFLTIGKVVVIRFHCLYICIHSKITKIFDKKKRFSFFSRQKKKKILKPTEKLMLSSQKRQVFITYNTYVSVCLHQQFQTLKHTKVFCDNQDLFNVCLKKKISVHKILYVILECYLRNYISSDEFFVVVEILT